jgi:hypothetical protein
MFLDMFEDEYRQMQINPVRLEYLLKDACMLYAPTTTPLSGVEFIKRLPSGDIERARRVRTLLLFVRKEDISSTIYLFLVDTCLLSSSSIVIGFTFNNGK